MNDSSVTGLFNDAAAEEGYLVEYNVCTLEFRVRRSVVMGTLS